MLVFVRWIARESRTSASYWAHRTEDTDKPYRWIKVIGIGNTPEKREESAIRRAEFEFANREVLASMEQTERVVVPLSITKETSSPPTTNEFTFPNGTRLRFAGSPRGKPWVGQSVFLTPEEEREIETTENRDSGE